MHEYMSKGQSLVALQGIFPLKSKKLKLLIKVYKFVLSDAILTKRLQGSL